LARTITPQTVIAIAHNAVVTCRQTDCHNVNRRSFCIAWAARTASRRNVFSALSGCAQASDHYVRQWNRTIKEISGLQHCARGKS